MKKILDYFEIDGEYGGNQDWFTNVVMNMGGCAAATACDSCIYFATKGRARELYPFDIDHLNKEEYKAFSQMMKPYIKPRIGGVRKLAWYIEGFSKYMKDTSQKVGKELDIPMSEFSGEHTYEEARDAVKRQIDHNLPIPCLLLHHKDKEQFKDFLWHWFLLVGYEETADDFKIRTATYGEANDFSLREMWDTGYEEKGGLILYEPEIIR